MIRFNTEEDLIGSGSTGPDLTPMIDMVFILLVFFLLTSVVVLPVLDIELPVAESQNAAEEIELIITLDAEGSIQVNKEAVPAARLLEHLQNISSEAAVKEVIIRADKKLPFGNIVEVMDIARKAGFESLSFLVEPQ